MRLRFIMSAETKFGAAAAHSAPSAKIQTLPLIDHHYNFLPFCVNMLDLICKLKYSSSVIIWLILTVLVCLPILGG